MVKRFRRVLGLLVAVLFAAGAWGVAPPTAGAQDAIVIELTFETVTGEPPPAGLAVLDVNTGIEYRNAGVVDGDSVTVTATPGVASTLEIRRTELQPGDINCEGGEDARAAGSGRVVITPGSDRVVCTVTLTNELALTGGSATLALVGATMLGAGALLVIAGRSAKD